MSSEAPGESTGTSMTDGSHDGVSGDGRSMTVPIQAPIAVAPSRLFDPSFNLPPSNQPPQRPYSAGRAPTSAEIDAVIAAAIANAPPAPSVPEMDRSVTPLMTNLLPSAVGTDGRVNLFVGNLPYRVRWQDLKDLFRKAGTVLRADVSLGPDNRSRGYGTVLMGSREDAARAIDRFNGFTWQTRTLEVRPDRLPPEYEPQPHQNHPPHPSHQGLHARPSSMFGFQSHPSHPPHPPYPIPGHMNAGNNPGWAGGPMHRPPPPGSQAMQHHFSMPSHGGQGGFGGPGGLSGPGGNSMGMTGASPIPASSSPASSYGPGGIASLLNGQHTGNQSFGASPLAGSLTSGVAASIYNPQRRDSLSPFPHNLASETTPPIAPVSTSPALIGASLSRPGSISGKASPHKSDGSRAVPPASLGSLPAPLFAGSKAVASPPEMSSERSSTGPTPPIPSKNVGVVGGQASHVAIAMEGLAHQGQHMGPPSTLHDRVVFVSNLPLSMQWQELKDLLRPAGMIIRADVATDSEGRPRGFGTALFASEKDAASAVGSYNGRDISGHRIRVSLERDIITESLSRRGSSALGFSDTTPSDSTPPSQSNSTVPTSSDLPTGQTGSTSSESPNSRVPWTINTTVANDAGATPSRQSQPQSTDQRTPQQFHRHAHHPGPISMPAFASFGPLDSPGHNPLSPMRGLPPMTPSMPGFVFNAYPETPPVHPHFVSQGMGLFSPGIPVTSPTGFQYNPFLNAAPGAPVNRFGGAQGGSAALGTPTTQSFPTNQAHAYPGPPGVIGAPGQRQSMNGQYGEYFPSIGSITSSNGNGNTAISNSNANGASADLTPSRSQRSGSTTALNAKDRLASTSLTDVHPASTGLSALMEETEKLNLGGNLSELGGGDLGRVTSGGSGSTVGELRGNGKTNENGTGTNVSSNGTTRFGGNGNRASIDGLRPNLGVWGLAAAERRASFGDIVAGRNKE